MQINKLLLALSTLVSVSMLASCGGGGSGSSSPNGGSSGGGTLNIQSVSSLDSLLSAKYNSMCVYSYANITTLVKVDGSGTEA